MLHQEKEAGTLYAGNDGSLSKKIISKMAMIVAAIFLLTILMAAFLAARSLIRVNKEKLAAVAFENAFLVSNDIENAYGKVTGFAGSLRNISALDPKEQRDAIDTALVGLLESGGGYPTGFAYFEQNAIADANGEPLEGVNKIAKTIENKGFSRKGKADGKNFVRWKPLHILERCKEKRQGKTAVRHGLGIVFKL